MLKDLPDWNKVGQKTFEDIKMMMVDVVVNTYFDPSLQILCVFSDTSEDFYYIVR